MPSCRRISSYQARWLPTYQDYILFLLPSSAIGIISAHFYCQPIDYAICFPSIMGGWKINWWIPPSMVSVDGIIWAFPAGRTQWSLLDVVVSQDNSRAFLPSVPRTRSGRCNSHPGWWADKLPDSRGSWRPGSDTENRENISTRVSGQNKTYAEHLWNACIFLHALSL